VHRLTKGQRKQPLLWAEFGERPAKGSRARSLSQLGRHRWVIERTIAWLFGYRRLTIRYERHAHLFCGFLTLAAALTCYKKLAK
jgi:transposase